MLSKAGDHKPDIPLVEVVGNAFKVAPEHIGETASNEGTVLGFTLIVNVVDVEHWTKFGVNDISSNAKSLPSEITTLS